MGGIKQSSVWELLWFWSRMSKINFPTVDHSNSFFFNDLCTESLQRVGKKKLFP